MLLVACIGICSYLIYQGYTMYKDAVNEVSIEEKVAEIRSKKQYTSVEELPQIYKDAIISVEDHRFYSHPGIDILATARAAIHDIQAMSLVEGGSTITQQLAKNLYFTQEKKFVRKIAEVFVAVEMERKYTKDEILELYVNSIYFGNNCYCVKDASMTYFNKLPKDMTDYESTLLAGIPNAPSAYSLNVNPTLAKQRQRQVIEKMVEFGHPKVDMGEPVFNYAVAYDTHNQEPLFYEKYPGSLNDISQLQFMLDKASGYGYKKIGFILDRGYFSCENIQYMDKCGYSFVIMVKGMSALVNELILENKGTFENKRVNNIYEYGVYGKTIRHKLYASDKKERYFHLYHSISKESAERIEIENRINQMTQYLKKYQNKVKEFGPGFEKYFNLHYDEKSQAFILPEERCSVVERELDLAGYFCIVTSEKMSAKEAIELYKSRDVSEKLFRGDKSYLGNKSIRVYSEESAGAKIFVEFVAMIVRCKMYIKLKEEMKKLDKKLNYMTVPAAIKELEKIEMVRQLDNIYRLDHAVTANQKVILKAFGLDANSIKYFASELSKELKEAE